MILNVEDKQTKFERSIIFQIMQIIFDTSAIEQFQWSALFWRYSKQDTR